MKTTAFIVMTLCFFILCPLNAFSSELEGCWKEESVKLGTLMKEPVCFEKSTIHAAGMTLDITERQHDGNKIKITYDLMGTTNTLYVETLDENRAHMRFPQHQGYFKKQEN